MAHEPFAAAPGVRGRGEPRGSGLVPATVTVIAGALLLLIPVRIVNLGFFPYDDALRHAAKVVSGKPWTEILVLRDGITMDYHPGWHAILHLFRLARGLDAPQLVLLSVVLLILLVAFAPLFFLERKEAWPAALLIILFAQFSLREVKPPRKTMALVSLAVALAVWTSGSWFLFALPLLAFLAAREWRAVSSTAIP